MRNLLRFLVIVTWVLSGIVLTGGVGIYYSVPLKEIPLFNYSMVNTALMAFSMSCLVILPLSLITVFGNSMFKKESEIAELKKKLEEEISNYTKARAKYEEYSLKFIKKTEVKN